MTDRHNSVPFYTRLESLKRKHAVISRQIEREQNNSYTADFYLKQLKRQKLLIKDQMEEVVKNLRRKSTANAA